MRFPMVQRIGFVLSPSFRAADIIGVQAVLGAIPLHRCYYISKVLEPVKGRANFPIVPNTTFEDCPQLDVLVIGEMSEHALNDANLLAFIQVRAKTAQHIIGISNGVLALAKAGVLNGKRATADALTYPKLSIYDAIPDGLGKPVEDGNIITAGPSTGATEAAFLTMKKLVGNRITQLLELTLEYDPEKQFKKSDKSDNLANVFQNTSKALKVGVLTPPGIYAPDIVGAVDVFGCLPNVEFHYLWKEKQEVFGLLCPSLVADTTFDDCPQLDVLIMGASIPKHCADLDVLKFIQRQQDGLSAAVTICAGALIAGAAGLLIGKNTTSNFHHTKYLSELKAIPSQKSVESDGIIYSAGPAIGSYEAALRAVRDIYGELAAEYIENVHLEYSPHPVYGQGSPEKAGKLKTAVSKAILSPLNPFFRSAIRRGFKAANKA
ncbi:DJ-1/PfpI family protein [Pseudovibrio sp. Tun.PSC04-5.I4]|uniref:DJ-1/PfpI family protein n=1 Tax=Pseudovibrio sp. Tun.PSC04-5.I4 TaxID=1798213 RepID=UPI000883351E|nr:DJ-1/PfpI family protein [Pseudovibrio sp. Tun.PSC04-5.I4]SDQ12794.1 cyclohexyl-isocyanide hydratase [Pseudovibrio sp. Tun.PSC04-5.I4]